MKLSFGTRTSRLVQAAFFTALALTLPFVTGQIPAIGNMLCPMHIPVILCGFFCGSTYGLVVGLISPLLRFLIFGAPVLIPIGLAMCFELGAYGFFAGFFYRIFPQRKIYVPVSLILSMIIGRVVWGIAKLVMYGLDSEQFPFGFSVFVSGAFVTAVPGIILQLVLIPTVVILFKRLTGNREDENR